MAERSDMLFRGKPIAQMTREELLEALVIAGDMIERMHENRKHERETLEAIKW